MQHFRERGGGGGNAPRAGGKKGRWRGRKRKLPNKD